MRSATAQYWLWLLPLTVASRLQRILMAEASAMHGVVGPSFSWEHFADLPLLVRQPTLIAQTAG